MGHTPASHGLRPLGILGAFLGFAGLIMCGGAAASEREVLLYAGFVLGDWGEGIDLAFGTPPRWTVRIDGAGAVIQQQLW
jgi:hypothetical protein